MTTPSDILSSAGALYFGKAAPSNTPAWMVSAPLNAWIPIPGTDQTVSATNWAGPEGNLGSNRWFDGWGAMALMPTGEIIVAAQGGHTDGTDDRVASLPLLADTPGWVTRTPQSAAHRNDQPYETDGKPTARHGYANAFWSELLQRVILVGEYASPGSGNAHFPTMDGWDPVSNTWDAIGTYPYSLRTGNTYPGPSGGVWPTPATSILLGAMMDGNGDVWDSWSGNWRYSVANRTWSQPLTSAAPNAPRFPWARDTLRNQMFGLCYGDGQGSGVSLGVLAVKQSGTVQTAITFNSSAALTQFIADAPQYAGMDYDPTRDKFLFYEGRGAKAGRIYEITPNSGTVWDMALFTQPNGAALAPTVVDSGLNNRFRYVPALKGFVMLPGRLSNAYFMRVA